MLTHPFDEDVSHLVPSAWPPLLRTMVPAAIPAVLFLIAVAVVDHPDSRGSLASPAAPMSPALQPQPQETVASDTPIQERIRLRIGRSNADAAAGHSIESVHQFARVLARRMKSLNLSVTLRVASDDDLPVAVTLAEAMNLAGSLPPGRIALSIDGSMSGTIEFDVCRTTDDRSQSELVP
jgi:hypothetical protein